MRPPFVRHLIIFLLTTPCMAMTIDVRSTGAFGNGAVDDTAAINRAISRTRPGDEIYFPAGIYRISYPPGIVLASYRTYRGDMNHQSIIQGTGGYAVASSKYNEAFGLALKYLVFDGGGLRFDGDVIPARHISVTHCIFRNIVTDNLNWTSHMGIYLPSGADNALFSNNRFYNIFTGGAYDLADRDATGIFGYGVSHTTITDNTFDFVNEGIHIFFDLTDGSHVLIRRNRFSRVHRIAIELQNDRTDGLIVEDNVVSDPLNPYWLTYGISVAATTSTGNGILIQGNTVIANTPLDLSRAPNNYYPYGLEAWGTNTVVRRNRVVGLWGIGIGIGASRNMLVEKNTICGEAVLRGKGIVEYYGPQLGTRMIENAILPKCPGGTVPLHSSTSTE